MNKLFNYSLNKTNALKGHGYKHKTKNEAQQMSSKKRSTTKTMGNITSPGARDVQTVESSDTKSRCIRRMDPTQKAFHRCTPLNSTFYVDDSASVDVFYEIFHDYLDPTGPSRDSCLYRAKTLSFTISFLLVTVRLLVCFHSLYHASPSLLWAAEFSYSLTLLCRLQLFSYNSVGSNNLHALNVHPYLFNIF